jgi:hypothetical protein
MARPIKDGLDYSPQDTDIHNDRKIRRLIANFGAKGYLVFDYLKCLCYKENGYWLKYNEDLVFDTADFLGCGLNIEEVQKIILECLKVGLFDSSMYNKQKILTSAEVQSRYIKAKRNGIIAAEMDIFTVKTPDNAAKTPLITEESTQKKGKENKEKENILFTEKEKTDFLNFENWISKHADRVGKMKDPFEPEQFIRLSQAYSIEQIKNTILKMHNYKPLHEKNISAYLTFLNWIKRENPDDTKTNCGKTEAEIRYERAMQNS